MPFRVHSLQGSSLKALSKSITDELRGGKRSIVSCVDSAIPDDGALVMRLTVLLRGNKRNIVNLYGITAPKPRACAIRVAKELINNLNPPRTQRHMIFTITVGPRASESPKPIEREPRRIEVAKNVRGAQSGLALGSAIETEHTTLQKCLTDAKVAGRGTVVATVGITDNKVAWAQAVVDNSAMRECVTDTLTDMSIKHDANVEPATYQCAMAFGDNREVRPNVTLELGPNGLLDEGPLDAREVGIAGAEKRIAVEPELMPPSSRLYQHLLERRFDGGGGAISPAPARLVIDPATPGSYILALLRDARAADFEISQFQIGSTVVANTTVPRPVLGRMANRPPRVTIIASQDSIWIGLATDLETSTLKSVDELALALGKLQATPGVRKRRDVVIAVESQVTAARIAPLLEAVATLRFDQILLADAQSVRAELAH